MNQTDLAPQPPAIRDLEGRRVIVVGASRGIGRRLACDLVAAGARTGLAARDAETLDLIVKQIDDESPESALALALDATDEHATTAQVNAFADWAGGIDAIVVTAGTSGPTSGVADLDVSTWRETIESNLTTAYVATHAAWAHLTDSPAPRIVLMGAVGSYTGMAQRAAYAAAKHGLIGLTRVLAREIGAYGGTANCVVPGSVDGDRIREVVARQAAARDVPEERILRAMTSSSPLKTMARESDVADLVRFLLTDSAARITGQELHVNAGTYFG